MSRPPYFVRDNIPPNSRIKTDSDARNFTPPVQPNNPLLNIAYSTQGSNANENKRLSYNSISSTCLSSRPVNRSSKNTVIDHYAHPSNHYSEILNSSSCEFSKNSSYATGLNSNSGTQNYGPQVSVRQPFNNDQFTKSNINNSQNLNSFPPPLHSSNFLPLRPNSDSNLNRPQHSISLVQNIGPNPNILPQYSTNLVPPRPNRGPIVNPSQHSVNFLPQGPNRDHNVNPPHHLANFVPQRLNSSTNLNLQQPQNFPVFENKVVGNTHKTPLKPGNIQSCPSASNNSYLDRCQVSSFNNDDQKGNLFPSGTSVNFNNSVVRPVFSIPTHLPPPNIQYNASFIYPPPPLNMNLSASVMPVTAVPENQCEKVSKLSQFLSRFSFDKTTKKDETQVVVPQFRSALSIAVILIKQLQECKLNLSSSLESNDDMWNAEIKKMGILKNELSEICSFISDPHYLESISKKLQIIKKKRDQKKRTKLNKKSEKLKKEQHRKERHQEIDKWFDDIKEKNLKQKREAEMKKEADYILLEVRKKIHEAKRTIEKIKVFEKLRNVRQASAIQKGLHILPEHNENFETKICILKRTMQRQLEDYEAEERAMKVMLETEQEGQIEEEHQWKMKKAKAMQQRKQKQIIESLFGNSEDPEPTDPMYLFHQFQVSANSSIDTLVNVRHQWDAYIAEDGEAIPQKWVVPAPPSGPHWESCLTTGTSKNQKV